MKRVWVFGVLVGVVLSSGAFWVLAGGPFFMEPAALSASMVPSQDFKTNVTPTQQTNQTPALDQAIQHAPPFIAEEQTLQSLSKEELQTLITLSGQNAIKSAINKVGPAVVQIDVTRPAGAGGNPLEEYLRNDPLFERFRENQPEGREATALGAGFFFEYNGKVYLLSNNHVTEQATSIQVTTQNHGTFTAHVIGADGPMDVAVLEIDDFRGRIVPTVALGRSSATEIGDWVVAIGNPLGLTQTVTAGIISALSRDIPNPNSDRNFRSLIQTDAAINPGNSGGPLVNAMGEVVGINTLIASDAEGLNFAINIDAVKRALPQLIENGQLTRAWLGVYIETVDEAMAERLSLPVNEGVLISDVVQGAPAFGSLRPNDIVTHVDGVLVTEVSELQDEIEFKQIGEPVEMTVVRNGQAIAVMVNLGQRPGSNQIPPPSVDNAIPEASPELDVETEALEKFGLQVEPLTENLANELRLTSTEGVVVVGIEAESRSAWARMRQGDVIVELNEQAIRSVADWNAVVEPLDDRAPLMLLVLRNGSTVFVVMN